MFCKNGLKLFTSFPPLIAFSRAQIIQPFHPSFRRSTSRQGASRVRTQNHVLLLACLVLIEIVIYRRTRIPSSPAQLFLASAAHLIIMSSTSISNLFSTDWDAIDAEIAKQRTILLRLLKRRNEMSPINGLPAEVLSLIFEFLAVDAFQEFGGDSEWVMVVGVCRRWREVALECPGLWIYFRDDEDPLWTIKKLRLSKSSLIHVSVDMTRLQDDLRNTQAVSEAFDAILLHSNRLQELSIFDVATHRGAYLATPFLPTMKNLCTLRIRTQGPTAHNLPANFIHCEMPSLRCVELDNVQAPWGSALLQNLRELRVSYCSSQLQPMLRTLASLTQLEVLKLVEVLDAGQASPHQSTYTPSPALNFPLLKSLSISQTFIPGVLLVDHILSASCPALASLGVLYRALPSEVPVNFDPILQSVHRVLLHHPGPMESEVDCRGRIGLTVLNSTNRHTIIDIWLDWKSPPSGTQTLARDFVLQIPPVTLKSLIIRAPRSNSDESPQIPVSPLQAEDWSRLFTCQPNLVDLQVSATAGALDALLASEGEENCQRYYHYV